ncbi:MAG: histidinol dehydrogenase, partial [Alphaproteobacteria bacterium]|nr:histidinol dehydrogenase [Alphaproteobacteria bacterium]
MPRELNVSDPEFEANFQDLLDSKRDIEVDVGDVAAGIIADVWARGDVALLELTETFDRVSLRSETIRLTESEISGARQHCDPETLEALAMAARRIEAFHQAQMPRDLAYDDADGVGLGLRWRPLDSVGLYVPGGKAAYPSSVLMNAIPARVAGVERRVITVPTPDGVLNPLVLAAAELAGVTE